MLLWTDIGRRKRRQEDKKKVAGTCDVTSCTLVEIYRLLAETFYILIQGWISELLILLPWNRGSPETWVRCSWTLIGFESQSDHPSAWYRRDVFYILCFTMRETQALLYSGPRHRWNRTVAPSWISPISLQLWSVWHLCAKNVFCMFHFAFIFRVANPFDINLWTGP